MTPLGGSLEFQTDRQLVERLAIGHHARPALRELLKRGLAALPAVREGLRHADPSIRYYCCRYLDHFLEPDVVPDLLSMLADPSPDVRCTTLHTLVCDRCKEGACRPDPAEVLPRALSLLARDADAHVRAMAVEAVGQFVHDDLEARRALAEAAGTDVSPAVRKKARWYGPGGAIFNRTRPRNR